MTKLPQLRYCETAIEFYTADLLPAVYDEWLVPLREQLRLEYLAVLNLLSSLLEQTGRDAAAIVATERWVRADPGNEAWLRPSHAPLLVTS